jgi:hypothetical protein
MSLRASYLRRRIFYRVFYYENFIELMPRARQAYLGPLCEVAVNVYA